MITKLGRLYPVGSYADHWTAGVNITDRGLSFVVDSETLAALFKDGAQPDGAVFEGFDSDTLPDGTARAFRYKMLARTGLPLLMDENAWRLFEREVGPMLHAEFDSLPVELDPLPAVSAKAPKLAAAR